MLKYCTKDCHRIAKKKKRPRDHSNETIFAVTLPLNFFRNMWVTN